MSKSKGHSILNGDFIRLNRTIKNMSQFELSLETNISKATINRMENEYGEVGIINTLKWLSYMELELADIIKPEIAKKLNAGDYYFE